MERKQKDILGFNVDLFSFDESIEYIMERIDCGESTHVVTINPEMIELACKNYDFNEALKGADMVIPDGVGIKIALKMKGVQQEQIPGIEFSKSVIEKCEQNEYPIALIGAQDNVIKKTVENLKKEFPNLNICYSHNGFFDEQEEKQMLLDIKYSQAKLVLVALGAPKQELFINKVKQILPRAAYVGVGGSFDVWAGTVQRAPIIFRKLGCEWLFRLLKQPSRFKRIFPTLPLFLIKVMLSK
ncbi:MAG: WecB/TagA/CpsF family glycosyltransferase [Candidatus Gastranaerophilales bacterium]|nr:WecB/TagA/CpsF family glycosyltransferase [Candidatus Gastranaerophilales bacterium]